MGKYVEFQMETNALELDNTTIRDISGTRLMRFANTVKFQDYKTKAIKRLEDTLPEEIDADSIFEEVVFEMLMDCYDAAYKDGISDLMIAARFNKLGILATEYPHIE